MWKVLLKILEVLLIIVATVILTPPLEGAFHKLKIWLADPATVLDDAAKLRSLSTETDLHSAVRKYESVLSRSNLDSSWKMRANQGLSRTYSDLSKIRYWRGLSRGDYPEKAQSYALGAEREKPGQFDTELALAYSYAAYEAESSTMTITKQKVRELMASHPENLEVQYLAWMAGVDEQASFPDKSNAENISDSMILLDVALDQAMHAGTASDQGQRDTETKRAEGFYKRAAELSPNNPFTPFVAGYLAAATNHLAEARDFFRDALQREREFPRARNNLGFAYAAMKDYPNARVEFEEAASTAAAPVRTRLTALHNLGETYLELKDPTKACVTWQQANELEQASEVQQASRNPASGEAIGFFHRAMCSYLKSDARGAAEEYCKAVKLGVEEGLDLANTLTLENELKAGP